MKTSERVMGGERERDHVYLFHRPRFTSLKLRNGFRLNFDLESTIQVGKGKCVPVFN
jgi:hypothetical protein